MAGRRMSEMLTRMNVGLGTFSEETDRRAARVFVLPMPELLTRLAAAKAHVLALECLRGQDWEGARRANLRWEDQIEKLRDKREHEDENAA